eukprot:evm.model.scf_2334.1 EVM.evm.TU.scf_2334.1   scf_2334:6641-19204(-)
MPPAAVRSVLATEPPASVAGPSRESRAFIPSLDGSVGGQRPKSGRRSISFRDAAPERCAPSGSRRVVAARVGWSGEEGGRSSKRPRWEGLRDNALWSGPPDNDASVALPHPVLGTTLSECISNYLDRNALCGRTTEYLFNSVLPNSTLSYDYIEFRTFGVEGLGIDHIGDFFVGYGYEPRELLEVPGSMLCYRWYSPPPENPQMPRIVVTEIAVSSLPKHAQEIVLKYTKQWRERGDKQVAALVGMGIVPWEQPTLEEFAAVYDESEFAAWALIHGYNISCASIAVHNIQTPLYKFGQQPYPVEMDELIKLLADQSVVLNSSGEEEFGDEFIKENGDKTIRQFASIAECLSYTFADGETMAVPGAYMAFTKRQAQVDSGQGGHCDGIDPKIMSHMAFSTGAAVPTFAEIETIQLEVCRRVEADGKKLTGEWTQEDQRIAEPYLKEIAAEMEEAEAQGVEKMAWMEEMLKN